MMEPKPHEITELLRSWSDGDQTAFETLAPLVHQELHRLAHAYMNRERAGHTLQTTALVNEAYLRLIEWKDVRWQNRAHFFAMSAMMMRRILVDFARSHPLRKQDGAFQLPLADAAAVPVRRDADLIALDEALSELAKFDERKSRIVEMRFFGGLTVEETAEVLGVAPITVMREWRNAKAWLYRELTSKGDGG